MDMETAVLLLDRCTNCLQDYRTTGYVRALQPVEKLSLQLNVEPKFKITRIRRRKQQFAHKSKDEVSGTQNPELYFKHHV
ncbi:Hypothetical protein CINCED_3A009481 [Cinara cedri]|uniref:Uncharacterized protein n=1 Tax=Cinara cedri TaxID=506608 RepID=A0A5E4M2R8_9HEMI|nr:Hypothetical protein CINCED_3A009481 [Cinara cedri]